MNLVMSWLASLSPRQNVALSFGLFVGGMLIVVVICTIFFKWMDAEERRDHGDA